MQIIEHIDAIARKKQRDAVFLIFGMNSVKCYLKESIVEGTSELILSDDWKNAPNRQMVLDWLDANHIAWQPCFDFAYLGFMPSYQGFIYIDVPCDVELPEFQKLELFFECPDGSRVFPDVLFCCLPLKVAMRNVEHDEPGFWEDFADKI